MGGDYFFWSELDRMVGYRKMQTQGSVFSTLQHAVMKLWDDDKALRAASRILLAEEAGAANLPGSPSECVDALGVLFRSSLGDYLRCTDELRQLAADEESAHGGEVEDLEIALQQVGAKYARILDKRPAEIVAFLAAAYLKRCGSLDAHDRYYFKEHAPVLADLKGIQKRDFEITMRVLRSRLAFIGQSCS